MMVPVGPFQARYRELRGQGESVASMAYRVGYTRQYRKWCMADSARLKRELGIQPTRTKGYVQHRRRVHEGTAERLCRALNLDPVDVGL